MKEKLNEIIKKYKSKDYDSDIFNSVEGGISDSKFVSKRHEKASNDSGKETLGKVIQIFKKLTTSNNTTSDNLETKDIRKIIVNYFSNDLEWHHSGYFKGKMSKTYFVNSKQIIELAEKWENILENSKKESRKLEIEKFKQDDLLKRKDIFLQKYTTEVSRLKNRPEKLFYCEEIEMLGKNGFFPRNFKYRLPEYYSGRIFKSEKMYKKFEFEFLLSPVEKAMQSLEVLKDKKTAKKLTEKEVREKEKFIAKIPFTSYEYATEVLEAPFELGEKTIKSNTEYKEKYTLWKMNFERKEQYQKTTNLKI